MSPRIRCAIYTRKSTEEGLEQDFNSLDAQYEACVSYIESQKAEGWVLVKDRFDDGGLSGGTLERPALQRLLSEIEAGRIDRIVLYKIDRLTRSLADFARIVERLDTMNASFVSVTQSFNTATSMGRLTLNMLLSFAQFERELTSERIRDKIAASKRKGLWMGGTVPLGYRANGRTLEINDTEASTIGRLYELYEQTGSLLRVMQSLEDEGYRSRVWTTTSGEERGGKPFVKAQLHRMLTNPIYAGRIQHYEEIHEGQHPAIIDPKRWEAIQAKLKDRAARQRGRPNAAHPSPLAGKLMDDTGDRLTPSHANRSGKRLRYYVSRRLITGTRLDHPDAWRLPAPALEDAIAKALHQYLSQPELPAAMIQGLRASEIKALQSALKELFKILKTGDTHGWADLLQSAQIKDGLITIQIDQAALAERLSVKPDRIDIDCLTIETPMKLRRRGIETRLILGDIDTEPAEHDQTLASNILAARRWHAAIRSGISLVDIAQAEGINTSRIRQMLDLAFLSTELLDQIAAGTQPPNLTSQWVKQHQLPLDWNEQRELLGAFCTR